MKEIERCIMLIRPQSARIKAVPARADDHFMLIPPTDPSSWMTIPPHQSFASNERKFIVRGPKFIRTPSRPNPKNLNREKKRRFKFFPRRLADPNHREHPASPLIHHPSSPLSIILWILSFLLNPILDILILRS